MEAFLYFILVVSLLIIAGVVNGNLAEPTREHAGLFSLSLASTRGRGVFTLP